MNKFSAIFLFFFLLSGSLFGAYLQNVPQTIKQPDGTILHCFATGDEYYNWLHDAENFTIIRNKENGFLVYADLVNDELVPTGLVPGIHNPSNSGLKPGLNISASKVTEISRTKFQNPKLKGLKGTTTIGSMNNIVIFIRFSDQSEYTESTSSYASLFNSTGTVSMYEYYREVSGNQLFINSNFFPTTGGSTVISYQDAQSRPYYQPYDATTNPSGYQSDAQSTNREHTLLKNATEAVTAAIEATGLNFDLDNDGYIDNVVFIVQGATDGWSDLLWPHRWSLYSFDVRISGKRVYTYNFQLSDVTGVSVLCHEMFHSLGAPDLYRYTDTGFSPVGIWDIMARNRTPPQHMSAYMKMVYGGWFSSIPEITTAGSYTLSPLSTDPFAAYTIASPNSSEYFLVEYRKSTGRFESSLPGDGLIIHRINPSETGNANGPPDEIYVYRPNGTLTEDGNLSSAYYSSGVGRTEMNDATSPSSFLSDGSDGGLNISNIGAAGTTISFDVSFASTSSATVTTTAISNITETTADSGGDVTADGNSSVTARGVCWSTSQSPTINDNTSSDGTGLGVFSSSMTGLTNGTTYYVRAYATNSSGTAYGNQVSFSTDLTISLASLSTTEISNIRETTAIGGGNITSDGNSSITARGVCWSSSQNPTTANNKTSNGSGTGGFSSTLTGLTFGIVYYVRAYATNGIGTAYGNQVSFSITNFNAATNLTATAGTELVELNWDTPQDGGATLDAFKVFRNDNLVETITDPTNKSFEDSGLQPGDYEYYLIAVYSNPVGESVPSNTASAEVVQSLPDLRTQNLAVSSGTINAGSSLQLSGNIVNIGAVSTSACMTGIFLSSDAEYDNSDLEIVSFFTPILAPQEEEGFSENITIPVDFESGTYYLIVWADQENAVEEIDEDNNLAFRIITIRAVYPDLLISNVNANLTQALPGQEININAFCSNIGERNAGECTLKLAFSEDRFFDINDRAIVDYTIPDLATNSDFSFSNSYTVPEDIDPGQYYLVFWLDGNETIVESDESNNEAYTDLEILNLEDIRLLSIVLTPDRIKDGNQLKLSFIAENLGISITPELSIEVILSETNTILDTDQVLKNIYVSPLNAGESRQIIEDIIIPFAITEGSYYIHVFVDPEQLENDGNPENNDIYRLFQIFNETDLQTEIYVDKSEFKPGEVANITVQVSNTETRMAESSELVILLSTDALADASDEIIATRPTGILQGNQDQEITVNYTIPELSKPGKLFYIAIADFNDMISESSERNNQDTWEFTILDTSSDKTWNDSKTWSLYPNPVQNWLTIRFAGVLDGEVDLTILNYAGQSVFKQSVTLDYSNSYEINSEQFPEGLYLIQIAKGLNFWNSKFIVVR